MQIFEKLGFLNNPLNIFFFALVLAIDSHLVFFFLIAFIFTIILDPRTLLSNWISPFFFCFFCFQFFGVHYFMRSFFALPVVLAYISHFILIITGSTFLPTRFFFFGFGFGFGFCKV